MAGRFFDSASFGSAGADLPSPFGRVLPECAGHSFGANTNAQPLGSNEKMMRNYLCASELPLDRVS